MDHHLLKLMLGLGLLLFLSVFASKPSSKYGIPILLLFIGVGIFAGSEGPGGYHFDDPQLTYNLGTISLIFILFSGGLSTQFKYVGPIWREGVTLSFAGVLISTALMALVIKHAMGWSWIPSALLGAAVSSTDAAAVFGILKTRNLSLRHNIQSLIELESGSNDPMAVFMTLSLIQITLAPAEFSWPGILQTFFIQMSLGGFAGWFGGRGLVYVINWLDLEFEGLYPVLTIAGVISLYALTEYCGGNGFLSVYLAGLTMGGEKFFSKKTLTVFHDGLGWLFQVAMFLAMGLLVNPTSLGKVILPGIIIALGLMFFARPLSVLACLWPFKFNLKEMWFVSWGGLRGAVPIILATYLLFSQVPVAHEMFNLVFFIVLFSMLIQGTTLGPMARWTQVRAPHVPPRRLPFRSRVSNREFIEFEVARHSKLIGKSILELNLPWDMLVVLIHRQELDFIPRGNTQIELYDRLVCLVSKELIPNLGNVLKTDP
jgi:potassium/hydrogen antiporter